METPETHWILSAFEQQSGEELVAEHALEAVSVEQLRAALGLPKEEEDPELLAVHPIQTEAQAERLGRLLGVELRLDVHDCFLEAVAPESAFPHEPRVQRKVTVFQKGPASEPVFEYELPRAPEAALRASLGPPTDDLGFHARWPIETQELADRLAPLLRAPLALPAYRYFLEYWDPRRTRPMVLAYAREQPAEARRPLALHPLHGVTKAQLRTLLGLAPDNPLAGLYPVRTDAQATALSRFLEQPLDLAARDYVVNYYAPLHLPHEDAEAS
jgi:hypothetical protein